MVNGHQQILQLGIVLDKRDVQAQRLEYAIGELATVRLRRLV